MTVWDEPACWSWPVPPLLSVDDLVAEIEAANASLPRNQRRDPRAARFRMADGGQKEAPIQRSLRMGAASVPGDYEPVSARRLGEHVGRLAVLRVGGTLYEVLGVGDPGGEEIEVTVPAMQAVGLGERHTATTIVRVPAGAEVLVRDAPVEATQRAELIRDGHQLVMPPRSAFWS